MPDEFLTQPTATTARPAKGNGRTMLIVAFLAFLIGAALVGWLAWQGRVSLGEKASAVRPSPTASYAAALPAPIAAPNAPSTSAAVEAVLDQRVIALEDRIARLDLQAQAAAGNAARAEGLLIALAARRSIERGAPLGYLEDQLKLRFGAAQPNAVQTIVAAASHPTTLDRLVAQLDALTPRLAQQPTTASGWGRLRQEISGLFTIRRDSSPAVRVEDRVAQARLLLQTGQVDAAVAEVSRLPGAAAATDWLGTARRYAAAAQALDLIETAAILETRELQDGAGAKVVQPSPLASPLAIPDR